MHGGLIEPIEEQGVVQAAASGDAITYLSNAATEAEPQGFSNSVQVLSARGAAGWSSVDAALPHEIATSKLIGVGQEYRLFSEDLSVAGAEPLGPLVLLSEAASEQTSYVRSDFKPGGGLCAGASCYRPLVTGCPPEGEPCPLAVAADADVPAGTEFGQEVNGKCPEAVCGPQLRGGTPDLSHVVVESEASLLSGSS